MHVIVAVLGDLGRSPRMQYHAQSLLEGGHTVSLIGYEGEDLVPALQRYTGDRLHVIRVRVPAPEVLRKILPIYLLWRIFSLTLWLSWAFFVSVKRKPSVDCLVLQNPPAAPLLVVAYVYCRTMGFLHCKRPGLVIDWHNLGYSMLTPGPFRKIAHAYEKAMAPLADGHLTVTKAMKTFLQENMDIADNQNIKVLYDCPPAMFRMLAIHEQHKIMQKLDEDFCAACPRSWYDSKDSEAQTMFTECYGKTHYRPRSGRPALIVSSTSWTPDEDFGILLQALEALDKRIHDEGSSLKVVCMVTGKGPQKLHYLKKMSKLTLQNVAIQTTWLDPADYPKLLACADLGVSLHTSTSGMDLPMKVLDMFGCEVPVCAVKFECLSELVQDDVNGRIFESSQQLSELLWEQLSPLTDQPDAGNHAFGVLDGYSKQLQGRRLWSENWNANALPVITNAAPIADFKNGS